LLGGWRAGTVLSMSWIRMGLVFVVTGLVVSAGCGPIVDDGGADTQPDDSSSGDSTTTTSASTTVGTSATTASTTVGTATASDVTTAEPPPPPGSFCQGACEQPVDCCASFLGDPTCDGMFGTYPYNFGCENGVCQFLGCTGDDDCTFGGALNGWICVPSDTIPLCQPGCARDGDCADIGLTDWICNGFTCEAPPCTDDASCGGELGLVCNPDTGLCESGCTGDGDCNGNGVCNPETRRCECTGDGQCDVGYVCAPP
jgi:hypothetical protein